MISPLVGSQTTHTVQSIDAKTFLLLIFAHRDSFLTLFILLFFMLEQLKYMSFEYYFLRVN